MQDTETLVEAARAAGSPVARIREFRALLTARCNFRCGFCHHEGVCAAHVSEHPAGRWLEMILAAVDDGCRDVTLSGGEPTLVADVLADILRGLAELPAARIPSVTVVTNGSRMDGPVVEALRDYPGQRKVNLSFHAADPGIYDRIVGITGMQPRVRNAVRRLVVAGVPVKLNAVVLRGINDRPEDLRAAADNALALGVRGIQFIPRLGCLSDPVFRREYVDAAVIEAVLAGLPGFRLVGRQSRKTLFDSASHPGLSVELTRCVCHMGCAACPSLRCLTVGPDLLHYPCMLLPGLAVPVGAPGALPEAFREGHRTIRAQIDVYRSGSPMTRTVTMERRVA